MEFGKNELKGRYMHAPFIYAFFMHSCSRTTLQGSDVYTKACEELLRIQLLLQDWLIMSKKCVRLL